ncbi:hypothetical protein ABIB40_003720 [Pedobacter sp. UYP30]|uniref:DUF3857 domain-containing protein n=1 Tax=Pedobacter sp. UYP30 TaxID=1756400 RepID=UPI0033919B65
MKAKLTVLCLLLFAARGFAQENYSVDLIPSNLKNRANAVIRNEETVVDMRSPDNVTLNVTKAITILNENGDENAKLVLFYDKNTSIKNIKGEVYNESGIAITKFNQKNFSDVSAADGFSLFVDSRVKHFKPTGSAYPYTVVYNYEIRYKQNLIIPDWTPQTANDISVEKSSYTFICKPTDELRIKPQNFTGKPEESTDEKQKMLTWKLSNVHAIKPEPFSPDRDTYQTNVKISAKDFTYYKHDGSYTNWLGLGKWIYNDLLKTRRILPPETVAMIKALVKNEKTDKDKARKVYEYMQNKTRYISVQIGIGGFQPVAAAEVDRLGYGDCKALVNYTQSLLEAAGIESLYCVVEAGNQKVSLDPSYASMNQGNHIILCMPLKGDTTWLECTSQKIPFGFLSTFTDDRLVLACTPEGGKLLRTPKLSVQNNLQIRNSELKITATGNAKGTIKTLFFGSQFDNHEEMLDKPINEQQKLLASVYDIDNINFDAVNYVVKKTIKPELTENIAVDIRNYAAVNNGRMFIKLNAFNVKSGIAEVMERKLPVYINRGYTDEDTITYKLPDEVVTTNIFPIDKKFKNEFGSYTAKTTLTDNKLTYYRKFVLNDGTFPPESYADFYKFITDVNAADGLKIILNLKK